MRPRVRRAHSLAHSFSEPEQLPWARGRPAPEDLWSPSQRGSASSSCFTPALSLRLRGCSRQVPHGPWAPAAVSTLDTNPGPCRKGLGGPRLPDSPLLHTSQGCGLGTRRLWSTPSWRNPGTDPGQQSRCFLLPGKQEQNSTWEYIPWLPSGTSWGEKALEERRQRRRAGAPALSLETA